jgi:AraC-like DNA-binding protein
LGKSDVLERGETLTGFQMLAEDYLTLRSVRLKPHEEWSCKTSGLSFVLPKGGAGKYVSGSIAHRLSPGDVLVIDGTSGAKLCAPERSELVFWCFSLCFEQLFPLFAGTEISLLQNVSSRFKPLKLYPASNPEAKQCHRLMADVPPQFSLDHRSQLLRAVAAILTVEFKTAQLQRVGFVRAEEHMVQVFERLSSNELLSSSVGELASKFGCSRRHLNRLFHQHFGFSVAALRMEMRLLKAVSLLRDPDAKIINVAEQCGFNHLGLFNTCFKRRFGNSPGQWRKVAVGTEKQGAELFDGSQVCPLRSNGLCPWSGMPEMNNPAIPDAPRTRKGSPTSNLTRIQGLNGKPGQQPIANPAHGTMPREISRRSSHE